jgi:superoxide dismutase, Cu-Zn family
MFAVANIRGASAQSRLRGVVYFRDVRNGTEVSVEVNGLPAYRPGTANRPPIGPHGFHIHGIGKCEVTNPSEPFTSAGEHWNPTNQPHGNHVGDFPVIFSNNGYAKMTFFTNKFKVRDVIGKSVIIHENPDDYRTQPAGASGKRIGCGVVRPLNQPGGTRSPQGLLPYYNPYVTLYSYPNFNEYYDLEDYYDDYDGNDDDDYYYDYDDDNNDDYDEYINYGYED